MSGAGYAQQLEVQAGNPGRLTLIEIRQNENKWGFIYFGADQDAWSAASSLGVANSVSYSSLDTGEAISAMSACRSAYVTTATSGAYNVSNLTCNVNSENLNVTSSGGTSSNLNGSFTWANNADASKKDNK